MNMLHKYQLGLLISLLVPWA